LLKLGLVIALLAVASRTRVFVQRRLPDLAHNERAGHPAPVIEAPAEQRVLVTVGGAGVASAACEEQIPEIPAGPTEEGSTGLRPFVTAVSVELCIGAGILAATASLVGRSPPS
jgi:hypothetical protein